MKLLLSFLLFFSILNFVSGQNFCIEKRAIRTFMNLDNGNGGFDAIGCDTNVISIYLELDTNVVMAWIAKSDMNQTGKINLSSNIGIEPFMVSGIKTDLHSKISKKLIKSELSTKKENGHDMYVGRKIVYHGYYAVYIYAQNDECQSGQEGLFLFSKRGKLCGFLNEYFNF